MNARILAVACLCIIALAAAANDTTVDSKPVEEPAAASASRPATTADAADAEFKPPPGFRTKKRGDIVLYCIKDSTVGTRFKTEKCYDEAQMRDYLVAQQENKRDMDRVRSTCSTGGEWCRRN